MRNETCSQDGVCEASMLLRRLQMFNFRAKLPVPAGLKVPECACCFARLCLQYASAHLSASA